MCATGKLVREFRAADVQTENYPTIKALRYLGRQAAPRASQFTRKTGVIANSCSARHKPLVSP
jgi:hypothetical protein